MIGLKFKKYLDDNNFVVENVAKQIGLSKQGLYLVFKKEDINTDLLRKFSNAVGVPINYWFENEPAPPPATKTIEEKYLEALEEIRALHNELKNIKK